MAARKGYTGRTSHRFLTGDRDSFCLTSSNDPLSELDEFELWNFGPDPRRVAPMSRIVSKKGSPGGRGASDGCGGAGVGRSVPVNVPDWSQILREENRRGKAMEDEEDEESENRIPPHEVVARRARSRRVASFSVHEGLGRTLKGKDLSRVRNAIWAKTGFQD